MYVWGAKLAYQTANKVYCVSRSLLTVADALGARTCLLPNGCDATEIGLVAEPSAAHSLGPPGVIRILMVGRLAEEKGFEYGFRALAKLDASKYFVTVVGDGPLRSSLESLADELGIRERVVFAGRIPRVKLGGVYLESDLLLHPSLSEAYPLTLVECMVAGVPVVATDVGGVSEIVAHGLNALVVPPGDVHSLRQALMLLVSKPDLLLEMRLNASNSGKSFAWGPILRSWSDDLDKTFARLG
jgi:glycosyltransferase involved in cell wall biosynthesis